MIYILPQKTLLLLAIYRKSFTHSLYDKQVWRSLFQTCLSQIFVYTFIVALYSLNYRHYFNLQI